MTHMKNWLLIKLCGISLLACATQRPEGRPAASPDRFPSVPAQAPDTVPGWFSDDTSYTQSGPRYLKHIAGIQFHPYASQEDRQAAIDSVGGRVVGGWRPSPKIEGFYAVHLPDGGEHARLLELLAKLRALPHVRAAITIVSLSSGPTLEPTVSDGGSDTTR
jgi:hypothetical protein